MVETHKALFARIQWDDITFAGENVDFISKSRVSGQPGRETLSRLGIQARKEKLAILLCSLLRASSFDVVVRETKAISTQGNNAFTLAGKIGKLLGHAVVSKICLGLGHYDGRMVKRQQCLSNSLKQSECTEWTKLQQNAKVRQTWKKAKNTPDAFWYFVMQRCVSVSNDLQISLSPACWTEPCRALLVRLVMFNKWRIAEVCEPEIETYEKASMVRVWYGIWGSDGTTGEKHA